MDKKEIQHFVAELNVKRLFEDKEYLESFQAKYNEVFSASKLNCLTCPGEINTAVEKLRKFAYSQIELGNSKIKIKNNGVLYSAPDHKTYNNDTLTDEAAMALIASNPNYKQTFDLPADFEEMFNEYKQSLNKAPKAEETKVEEVKVSAPVGAVSVKQGGQTSSTKSNSKKR